MGVLPLSTDHLQLRKPPRHDSEGNSASRGDRRSACYADTELHIRSDRYRLAPYCPSPAYPKPSLCILFVRSSISTTMARARNSRFFYRSLPDTRTPHAKHVPSLRRPSQTAPARYDRAPLAPCPGRQVSHARERLPDNPIRPYEAQEFQHRQMDGSAESKRHSDSV